VIVYHCHGTRRQAIGFTCEGRSDPDVRPVDRPFGTLNMRSGKRTVGSIDTMGDGRGDDAAPERAPRDGSRVDRTVTPVTRRVVDVEAERVRRIEVRDDDDREFPVFVSPAPAPLVFVEPGRRYRVVGLLWSDPPTGERDPRPCLACGNPLRPGRAVDGVDPAVGQAARRLDITEPFGIVDGRTVVERPEEPRSPPVTGSPPVPRAVCDVCGYREE
jgi:hypothetical protein